MKCVEVSEADVRNAAQLVNMLHVGQWEINGKDVCASADTIRWAQQVAVAISKGFQAQKVTPNPPATSEAAKPEDKPEGEGFSMAQVKEYHPGKVGRGKK